MSEESPRVTLRSIQSTLDRFKTVLPQLYLQLRQHVVIIRAAKRQPDLRGLNREHVAASKTFKSLKYYLRELDQLEHRVVLCDLPRFKEQVDPLRHAAYEEIVHFVELDNDMDNVTESDIVISPHSNVTSSLPEANVTSSLPNVTSSLPTANVISPHSNVTSSLPRANVTSSLPTANVTSPFPNVTPSLPRANVISPHSNVTSSLPTANVTSPHSNVTSPFPNMTPSLHNVTSSLPNVTSSLPNVTSSHSQGPPNDDLALRTPGEAPHPELLSLQLQERREEEGELGELEATAESWKQLQNDIQDVAEIMTNLAELVKEQGEELNTIESNVQVSALQTRQGLVEIIKARRARFASVPIAGAVVGCVVGGPVGLLVGFKAAGILTAALGSYFGYKGAKFIKNRVDEEGAALPGGTLVAPRLGAYEEEVEELSDDSGTFQTFNKRELSESEDNLRKL